MLQKKNLQGAPLLFITNPTIKHSYTSLSDSAALPAQESSPGLTYRCEVIIDHSKHQLLPPVVLLKEPLTLTFRKRWLGEANMRL